MKSRMLLAGIALSTRDLKNRNFMSKDFLGKQFLKYREDMWEWGQNVKLETFGDNYSYPCNLRNEVAAIASIPEDILPDEELQKRMPSWKSLIELAQECGFGYKSRKKSKSTKRKPDTPAADGSDCINARRVKTITMELCSEEKSEIKNCSCKQDLYPCISARYKYYKRTKTKSQIIDALERESECIIEALNILKE